MQILAGGCYNQFSMFDALNPDQFIGDFFYFS